MLSDKNWFAIEIASSLSIDGELTGTSTLDNLKVLKIPITNIRAIPIIFGFKTLEADGTVLTTSGSSAIFFSGGVGTKPSFNDEESTSDHFWCFILKYKITSKGINPPTTVINLSKMYPEEYQIGNENNTTSYT